MTTILILIAGLILIPGIFIVLVLLGFIKPDERKILVAPPCKLDQAIDSQILDGYTMGPCSDFTTGVLVEDDTGGYEIIITSTSGNHSTFALNNYAHGNGFPLHTVYSTGDKVWFYPCGKVRLVQDSNGKYWK